MTVTLLLILNRKPDDGTDVTWNALRLALQALKDGMAVRIFLMNDSVDLAREGFPPGPDYDLQKMLLDAVSRGAQAKLCKTCITRCGLEGKPLRPEIRVGTMPELSEWIQTSDRVVSF